MLLTGVVYMKRTVGKTTRLLSPLRSLKKRRRGGETLILLANSQQILPLGYKILLTESLASCKAPFHLFAPRRKMLNQQIRSHDAARRYGGVADFAIRMRNTRKNHPKKRSENGTEAGSLFLDSQLSLQLRHVVVESTTHPLALLQLL